MYCRVPRHHASRSANILEPSDRGAELEQLRQELASAQDGRRVSEALKTAELEKLRLELNRLKDENRVTEASQLTFRVVTESNLEHNMQILAKARFEAATLRSEIASCLHAHTEVMTEVKFFMCKICISLCPTFWVCFQTPVYHRTWFVHRRR